MGFKDEKTIATGGVLKLDANGLRGSKAGSILRICIGE